MHWRQVCHLSRQLSLSRRETPLRTHLLPRMHPALVAPSPQLPLLPPGNTPYRDQVEGGRNLRGPSYLVEGPERRIIHSALRAVLGLDRVVWIDEYLYDLQGGLLASPMPAFQELQVVLFVVRRRGGEWLIAVCLIVGDSQLVGYI